MMPATLAPRPELGRSYVVEASAGTGKTRELVHRIADVLAAGAPVEGIVAVTFTDAAAGHMKLRVRERLDEARRSTEDPIVRDNLARALQRLDRAFIGTIHAFCAQLLHQRPVEAEIDPAFQELDQAQAEALFASVFRGWIERKLATGNPVLRRTLERLAAGEGDGSHDPIDRLREAAWRLIEWRDHPASWERREFDRASELTAVLNRVREFVALRNRCEQPASDELFKSMQSVADFLERARRAVSMKRRDDDRMEAELIRLPRNVWIKNGRGKFADGVSRESVIAAWEELEQGIQLFRQRSSADLAAALRDELWETEALYTDAKRRAGKLDFTDLLIRTRDLLANDDVRRHFQKRFQHIFVDEFQDTDPLQAEILLLLASDGHEERDWRNVTPASGKLFVVGDPKQSIYRFRRADVELYRGICGDMTERGAGRYTLQTSKRSVDALQQFVNAAFEGMPGYLPLEGGAPAHGHQPSLVALPMPEPYPEFPEKITKKAIDRCSPHTVAAFIEWLVNSSGWTVRERPDAEDRRPVRPEDICILFRRFTNFGEDLTRSYVRSLEARGIRHVLVGSKSFHRREEVGVIRTALRAIEWPDDELSVFAVLRGGLFAIADGTLLKFRDQYGRFFPFVKLPEDLDPEFTGIRDALRTIGELHRLRNHQSIVDTINQLLEHVRAHVGFAFRKGGERVLANVYRLRDLARAFETANATSFRSFVEYLESEYDAGEAAEATVLEQSADGVKLMTVHKAKGLEFPVVILADMSANLSSPEGPDRYVDAQKRLCAQKLLGWAPWELLDSLEHERQADLEEAWRIAYVAATRARDLLVVTAIGEQEMPESWLSPLHPALYPHRPDYRAAKPAPGCPAFGDRTVWNRPASYGPDEVSIHPGLHSARAGGHGVVWFDPSVLRLQVEEGDGIAHEIVLKGSAAERQAGRERYQQWQQQRAARNAAARQPSHSVVPVTAAEAEADLDRIPVEVIQVSSGSQPVTRGFGKLVHAILQHATPGATREHLSGIARVQVRLPGQQTPEVEKAVEVAFSALQHPVLQASGKAARCHREYPVSLRLPDSRVVEGVIDLAYFAEGIWTVVDFKTGAADQSRYRRQLSLYATALSRATGQPVRAFLLSI